MRSEMGVLWMFVQHSLLIALAIHGLTPDADDLASTKTFQVLCQLPGDGESTADHAAPSWGEVCAGVRSPSVQDVAAARYGTEQLVSRSNPVAAPLDRSRFRQPLATLACGVPPCGLTRSLCRPLC
jgi:hypothetical protein